MRKARIDPTPARHGRAEASQRRDAVKPLTSARQSLASALFIRVSPAVDSSTK